MRIKKCPGASKMCHMLVDTETEYTLDMSGVIILVLYFSESGTNTLSL